MLYDPKWEVEVKADPLSLGDLIAWLETKPVDGKYCYSKWNDCLLSQWAQSFDPSAYTSHNDPERFPTGFHYLISGKIVRFGEQFQKIAQPFHAPCGETWSAALDRARKALVA